MLLNELWEEIKTKWPKSFTNPQSERSWARTTYQVLEPFEGETLARAWHSLLTEYQKTNWPGPALILDYCRKSQQSQTIGSGGMGLLRWEQYRAWLQHTRRLSPNLRPYPQDQLRQILDSIPDADMVRLGTPRAAPNP